MANTIPPRTASPYCGHYGRATDIPRLLQIFTESHTVALESKNPQTAKSRFGMCVEMYYQVLALRAGPELERKITDAMQTLADCFPSVICINESLGLGEKANKAKTYKGKLTILKKAEEILSIGLARNDIGYASIKPIYDQVIGYIKELETLIKGGSHKDHASSPALEPAPPSASLASQGVPPVTSPSEFKFNCPNCGQHILAPRASTGAEVECPTCLGNIVIPNPAP